MNILCPYIVTHCNIMLLHHHVSELALPYRQTGMAHFYPKGSEKLERMVTNMHSCNLPVSLVDAKQAKDLCPYLNVPDNFIAAVEEEAGILAGSKAVAALQVMF